MLPLCTKVLQFMIHPCQFCIFPVSAEKDLGCLGGLFQGVILSASLGLSLIWIVVTTWTLFLERFLSVHRICDCHCKDPTLTWCRKSGNSQPKCPFPQNHTVSNPNTSSGDPQRWRDVWERQEMSSTLRMSTVCELGGFPNKKLIAAQHIA